MAHSTDRNLRSSRHRLFDQEKHRRHAPKKNTVGTRRWHAFNARYNTYFNGSQAFIEGNMEKEKGHQDNFTEMLPLYPVGKRESREIGKGQYDRAIEKCEKTIRRHSIKVKPEWNKDRRKTAKDREWLGRRTHTERTRQSLACQVLHGTGMDVRRRRRDP